MIVDTDSAASVSSVRERSEDRRAMLDLILAGCICLAAVCYWFWDAKPAPAPVAPVAEFQ